MHHIFFHHHRHGDDSTPLTINVIDVTGAHSGHPDAVIQEVTIPAGKGQSIQIPDGAAVLIREDTPA